MDVKSLCGFIELEGIRGEKEILLTCDYVEVVPNL